MPELLQVPLKQMIFRGGGWDSADSRRCRLKQQNREEEEGKKGALVSRERKRGRKRGLNLILMLVDGDEQGTTNKTPNHRN